MRLGLLLLRLIIGGLFIGHGAQKLFGSFGGFGPDGTGQFFESSLGLAPGKPMAIAAGVSEAGGGALVALGAATPLGSCMLTSTMITAIWKVHRQNGVWASNGGYEYNLILIAALFALADHGPGEWSVDAARGSEMNGATWALLQLALATAGSAGLMALGLSLIHI